MNILLPKFHPVTWVSFFAFYVLCLLEGGDPNPEFLFAAWPAIAIGVGAALGIGGAIAASNRQSDAIKAQKTAERKRRKSIKKVLGPEARRAKRRLKRGKYGLSKARQQETTEELQRATEAQAKGQRAELERGEEGAYGPGRKDALKRALAERQMSTVAQGRLGTARMSEQLGQQQQQADRSTVQHYGATLGGLTSQVPQMQLQTPGMFERLAGVGTQGLVAAGTLGAFSGGGGVKGAAPAGAGSQYAGGDTGAGVKV